LPTGGVSVLALDMHHFGGSCAGGGPLNLGFTTFYLHTTSIASGVLLIVMGNRPAHNAQPLGCADAADAVGAAFGWGLRQIFAGG